MGCFIVYPVSFVSLVTILALRLTVLEETLRSISTATFFLLGGALLVPKVLAKIAPGDRSQKTRIVTKAMLAIGLALLAFPFFFRPSERIITAAIFLGFLVPYVIYKGMTVTDDCAGCPEAEDFPNCSGMAFDGKYRFSETTSETEE